MTTKYNVSAKFGQKEIVSGDINNYFSPSANIEWTDNLIYRNSKLCDVTTTFSQSNKKPNMKSSDSSFRNIFPIVDEKTFADYFDKKANFEAQLLKKKDKVESQKNEFITNTLKIDNQSVEKVNVNKAIKEQFLELLKKDESLRKKLKINNNLSNINIQGNSSSINTSQTSISPQTQPQLQNSFNKPPYQNPNQMYQPQQSYYNYNQGGGFSNYTYQ
jgi:hypothetical protein